MRRQTTAKVHAPDGSLTISEMDRRESAWRDEQPMTSRCSIAGCDWSFSGTSEEARAAFAGHRHREHRNIGRVAGGRRAPATAREKRAADGEQRREAVAERLASEDTRVAPAPSAAAGRRNRRWTQEEAIAAVQAFARERGRPPKNEETVGDPRFPSQPTMKTLFGGFAAMVEAAGFERPTRRTRYAVSSEREPVRREAVEQPLPAPTPQTDAVDGAAPPRSDDIARAELIHRLRWAADGVFSVPVSPQDARRLLEEIGA